VKDLSIYPGAFYGILGATKRTQNREAVLPGSGSFFPYAISSDIEWPSRKAVLQAMECFPFSSFPNLDSTTLVSTLII